MVRSLGRASLIAVLCLTLAIPSRAETLTTARNQLIAGIVVVGAAMTVFAILVIHHKHKPQAITGCVRPGATGMTLTDERNKEAYTLSGDPVGVKVGDRMTLEGKLRREGAASVFEAQRVARDFGACHP